MKIAVLLSGGVDSSVALAELVREQKHEIQAFYLKIWLEDDLQYLGQCPWEEDLHYAQGVCEKLGVPLEIISLQTAYWDRVVAHSIRELKAGRTPSPDILCNQNVKFGAFCDLIDGSYERIATGHYARQRFHAGHQELLKGIDPIKDQTYFLSRLSQAQLDRAMFPIGHLPKAQVRSLAAAYDLPTQNRPDSQGICFLGKLKFSEFVKAHLGEKPGAILELETGRQLGVHQGFWFHTIGQRRGLGLSGGPWFVVQKDPVKNIVYVSTEEARSQRPQLEFTLTGMHWLGTAPVLDKKYTVKIRHGAHTTACHLTDLGEQRLSVLLASGDGGIAPGQYAVIYDGEHCLGAGLIE
ncbi:MAG: tRNA 2-thiouridine(34) synthase MnmA [Proteobacteria bacterium]|nr:tRNA 2-thiouridine(34) synthase MnmA [Pseudomonadota bacterium]